MAQLKVIQLNTANQLQALNRLKSLCRPERLNPDIILLQDVNRGNGLFTKFKGAKIHSHNMCDGLLRPTHSRSTGVETITVFCNLNLITEMIDEFSNNYIVSSYIKSNEKEFVLCNVYFPPRIARNYDENINLLRELCTHPRWKKLPIIMTGDWNAHHEDWDPALGRNDAAGRMVSDFWYDHELHLMNSPQPTFRMRRHEDNYSTIDLTFATHEAEPIVQNWSCKFNFATYDHGIIQFSIDYRPPRPRGTFKSTRLFREPPDQNWMDYAKAVEDQQHLVTRLEMNSELISSPAEADQCCIDLRKILIKAAEETMTKKKQHPPAKIKHRMPWLTPEVESLAEEVDERLRAALEESNLVLKQAKWEAYSEADGRLQELIDQETKKTWLEYISDEGESTPWGRAYRLMEAARSTNIGMPLLEQSTNLRADLNTLQHLKYPDDKPREDTADMRSVRQLYSTRDYNVDDYLAAIRDLNLPQEEERETPYSLRTTNRLAPVQPRFISNNTEDTAEFGEAELQKTIFELDRNKAPGLDNISNAMIQASIYFTKKILLNIMNTCLRIGYFPKEWKKASAIYIPKHGKSDYKDPDSYRPISLLSNLGKLFERLIKDRLEHFAEGKGLNWEKQFGFRRGGSTIHALSSTMSAIDESKSLRMKTACVAFDLRGAFDFCWWPNIHRVLHQRNYPRDLIKLVQSYLSDRSVQCSYGSVTVGKAQTRGTPQGSVLSPLLFNLSVDPTLRKLDQDSNSNCQFNAYADDLSCVLRADNEQELIEKIQFTIQRVKDAFRNIGLELNMSKCHVLTFTGTRIRKGTIIPIDSESSVSVVTSVKILGVTIDRDLRFIEHVKSSISRLTPIRSAYFRVCRNTCGLDSRRRAIIYTQVFRAALTYGSEIWSSRISDSTRGLLKSFQHRMLVNVVCGYRTISIISAQALSHVEPIDLFMKRKLYEYEALTGNISEGNPIAAHLLPNAPPNRKPTPEIIRFESPAEMALLSQKIKVMRVRRQRGRRRRESTSTENSTASDSVSEDLDEGTVEPTDIPPLPDRPQGNYYLYISARMKQVNTTQGQTFRFGLHFRLYTDSPRFYQQGMRFYHFVDRQQITQLALKEALDYMAINNIARPHTITIINDELEATRFIENARWRVNETEHAIIEHLYTMNCKLICRRPTRGDETFRSVTKAALRECTGTRTVTFLTYNKKFVKRTARNWLTGEFKTIYNNTANRLMRRFFPTLDIPRFVVLDFIITQFLTGHGRFLAYLEKYVPSVRDKACPHCDGLLEQTSEHALLECLVLSSLTRQIFHYYGLDMNHPFRMVQTPQTFELFKRVAHELHHRLNMENRT